MKLFLRYLSSHKKSIAFFLLTGILFSVSFALYHLPVMAALYPFLLCLTVGLVLLVIDFTGFKKKHDLLSYLEQHTASLIQALPQTDGILEEDYQALLRILQKEFQDAETASETRYQDMIAYYTLWAHQIKTPIAAMKLTLQYEDSHLARQISGDLFRIEQYVEMVMMFLRLGSSSTDYVIREYELTPILNQTIKKFAGEFILRRLTIHYEPVEATVLTDEKWLSFVIEQLLSNALKYTRKGGITIRYDAEKHTLHIEDTGIGIAPEDLPRIFENGYTGYNGRRDKKASGLGLYLCKTICDKLNHTLSITSTPDMGTEVSLTFPVKLTEM